MLELDLPDDALAWATRGIEETRHWQTDRLYDLACAIHMNAGRHMEVLAIRRAQHERSPTAGSYSQLRRAAETLDAWALEGDPRSWRCVSATCTGSSTRCSTTVTPMRHGRLRSRSRPASSAKQRGYDLPRRGRRPTRPTRSRST